MLYNLKILFFIDKFFIDYLCACSIELHLLTTRSSNNSWNSRRAHTLFRLSKEIGLFFTSCFLFLLPLFLFLILFSNLYRGLSFCCRVRCIQPSFCLHAFHVISDLAFFFYSASSIALASDAGFDRITPGDSLARIMLSPMLN